MSTHRGNDDSKGPRRSTLAILAFLTAAVCGASTWEVAMTRPAGETRGEATPIVLPVASPASSYATPAPTAISPRRPESAATNIPTSGSKPTASPTLDTRPTSLKPELALLGTWTVNYVVGRANGNGANIVIPLERLDGRVIKPGATFDFWSAVGEVSQRTGYRRGAIITGHRIVVDGALAGGICTVSTALFNAAARAGLQITARTSHGGYLAKYPLGLDAAVAKGDHFRQTLAFRNDSTEPIVIRTVSTPGIARVDLYAKSSLDRKVELSEPSISHRQKASDRHVASTSLPSGTHRRVEARSDGMTVVVNRTVRDGDGHLLHRDRWVSVYRWLGGLVLDGVG